MIDYKPNKRLVIYVIASLLLITAVILAGWYLTRVELNKPLTGQFRPISDCFITAPNIPYYEVSTTLGAIVEAIIECESNGDPEAQNPTSSAFGLCQFLDSTWEYVQNKWNMELDRDDPEDQLYACKRLCEEEGTSHWKQSQHCWLAKI